MKVRKHHVAVAADALATGVVAPGVVAPAPVFAINSVAYGTQTDLLQVSTVQADHEANPSRGMPLREDVPNRKRP
ncbi:hypothetical protein [Nonomuraea lactucae]|uniref:hypothetical protein n=1 Tax=Nonomuraea lactucae TaxID=2249762 RepID=UPI000DE30AAA|nr:hypothetical protein [Nonomuraea lactucae]